MSAEIPFQTIKIVSVSLLEPDAVVLKKAEWSIELIGFTGNPFDSRQIQVDVDYVSPDGVCKTVPAFWYKDFKRELLNGSEVLHPQGIEHWRVRFTPHLDGEWRYEVRVTVDCSAAQIKSGSFHVAKWVGKGFIHVSKVNQTRFAFEDGSTYVPIGENNGWWASDNGKRSYIYETWFEKMASNGANYSRIWMCSWGFGLIWQDSGLYDYTNRLDRAYQLDCLFNLAEQQGIYLQLALFHHGPFSKKVNPQWDQNPFNCENGGPLKEPNELFTHPEAKEIVKNYLRYLVARYGYSTNLFCWELFNEINWMTDYDQAESAKWHSEMASVLHQLDPYHHLVSSSSTLLDDRIHSVDEHDFINIHSYEAFSNLPAEVAKMQQEKLSQHGKPVLLSEIGISGSPITTQELDPEGIHFHQSLWSGVFGGGTGSGMTWWWDSYIENNNLYTHYASLAKMSDKVPWQDQSFSLWKGEVVSSAQFNCSGYGYQTDTGIYLWLADDSYHYLNPSVRELHEVRIKGMGLTAGSYSLLSIDPYNGEEIICNSFLVEQGCYEVVLPSWRRDMAFVIEKQQKSTFLRRKS
ncbi:MAG: hypothetical protein JWN30_2536 [Bacilli bacterium]|nr:hypothetical protein [Bacilli bacterium]